MNKYIILSVFAALFQVENSYSQGRVLEARNSPLELNKVIESEKLEFQVQDEDKIDVEMLGLDDVEEKNVKDDVEEIATKNFPSENDADDPEVIFPTVGVPKPEKAKEDRSKEIMGGLPKIDLPAIGSEKTSKVEIEVAKVKAEMVKVRDKVAKVRAEVKKVIADKQMEVEKKAVSKESNSDKEKESSAAGGFLGKIQSFIDKKSDNSNGKKKITLKLLDALSSKDREIEVAKDAKEIERRRLAKEKKERLSELREKYLIKVSDDGKFKDAREAIIVPQKKQLSWGDSFSQTVDMPPPLLSRDRSADNSHIPIIPTFEEKVASLFSSARTNDISAFNNSYAKIAIPDLKNRKGDTILTYAMLIRNHSVTSSILSKGADPDLPNALGHTPLDIAIENMDLKGVKIIIDNEANINYVDKYNRTFLMLAARKGYLPVVQMLAEHGAKINEVDSYGRTALTIAYRHKKEIIAKYLIINGAKAWIEKPYDSGDQKLIKELENRWKRPVFNLQ